MANGSHDSLGDVTVVGVVLNNTADKVSGPISVTVVCFQNDMATAAEHTYTEADLAARASSSFALRSIRAHQRPIAAVSSQVPQATTLRGQALLGPWGRAGSGDFPFLTLVVS